jgi:hypothetical protein
MFFAAVTVEILLESAPSQFLDSHLEYYLSSYIILGWYAFFVLRNFAAPKRQAHDTVSLYHCTVSSGTYLRTDRVCMAWGGAGFEPGTWNVTTPDPLFCPDERGVSHLS